MSKSMIDTFIIVEIVLAFLLACFFTIYFLRLLFQRDQTVRSEGADPGLVELQSPVVPRPEDPVQV